MNLLLTTPVACWTRPVPPVVPLLGEQAESLLHQLSPLQRMKVLAALVVLLVAAAFLFLVIRAGGRITRWYVEGPRQPTTPPGLSERSWQRKPRVSSREREHWQKPQ